MGLTVQVKILEKFIEDVTIIPAEKRYNLGTEGDSSKLF